MRKIERTKQFKRDFKREMKGRYKDTLDTVFTTALQSLVNDFPLEAKYKDHALTGIWENSRDCHIKPDLVLIYQKPDDETLLLVRLGSYSELGF